MGFYLLDHPNPHGEFFYRSRRGPVVAIVVHVTAGLQAAYGVADHSAEGTARWAATNDVRVSWHSGSDTDSSLDLLPASYTAWQCQHYNSSTYGHEISKRDVSWSDEDPRWIAATLRRAAAHLAPKAELLGVPIRHATKAEVDRAIAAGGPPVGFIGHRELNPDTRTDPGADFPWEAFLRLMKEDDVPLTAADAKLVVDELLRRGFIDTTHSYTMAHTQRMLAAAEARLAAKLDALGAIAAGDVPADLDARIEATVRRVFADAGSADAGT